MGVDILILTTKRQGLEKMKETDLEIVLNAFRMSVSTESENKV